MRRPNPLLGLVLTQSVLLLSAVSAAADSGVPAWPAPPADPVISFESVLSKLTRYEVAVQGPTEGPRRVQKLKRPAGIAFDARGRLLVTDSRQGLLLMIDIDLGVALVFGTGTDPSLREPMGVAIHRDGTIYVADAGLRRVVAFDSRGKVTAVYGEGGLTEPTDVALSPDGTQLYVVDTKASQIAIFDRATRRRLETFGSRGPGVGEFILPTAVEFDAAGNLLIVDQLNARVQIFDRDRAFTRALHFPGISRPHGIAADVAGRLWVTDKTRSLIQVYGPDLEPLLSVGRNGLREGEFLAIGAIATRGDQLAALDEAGGRLQLFRLHGVEATAIAEVPAPATESAEPLEETSLPRPSEPEGDDPLPTRAAVPGIPASEVLDEAAEAEREEPEEDEISVAEELLELVGTWASAWSAQEVDRYLGFYARSFQPADGSSRDEWAALRRRRLTAPTSIVVELEIVETRIGVEAAEITLLQSYTSDRFADRVRKLLRLVREEDGWKIDRETVLETL